VSSQVTASAESLLNVVRIRDEANAVARSLLGGSDQLVEELSLRLPVLTPAELGFLRAVAWAYVQYFEAGLVGIRFVVGLFDAYNADDGKPARNHVETTGRLRTYLQHNLSPAKPHDKATQDVCEAWFESQCGSRVPGTDGHWKACLAAFLVEAEAFYRAVLKTLREIESDASRQSIVEQWQTKITRHHSPAAFDAIISAAAEDMGREHLEVVQFRKRYYDRWIEALRSLDGDYEFDHEARRLVERSLLTDVTSVLPITGSDVIAEFGIDPGPDVGRLLQQARLIYEANPCSRDELILALRTATGSEAPSA
jgi:hypothetical protein